MPLLLFHRLKGPDAFNRRVLALEVLELFVYHDVEIVLEQIGPLLVDLVGE